MALRRFFRPMGILVLVATVATLGMAACSGDDDGDEPEAASTTAAEASSPGATATESGAGGANGATGATGATGAEATATSAPASEGVSVSVAESDDLGSFLVGPDGMTLYVFTRDTPNMTNCTGNCLDIWPPLLLEDGQEVDAGEGLEGTFDSIDTPSGTQVTYDGAPLYYFASDTAEGDTSGHLVGNVWFVARPDTSSTAYVNVSPDGEYLVGPTGMTLYFFENDSEGVSNCTGECLENWPALTVPEDLEPSAVDEASGTLDTITREDDGTFQITYNGMPLYYFAADELPGDTNGDGVGDVWILATP